MAYFAKINDNNIVEQVIKVANDELIVDGIEVEQKGIEFCQSLFDGNWIQTSYNNRIRKQYAGVGYTYDPDADVFIAPQPYASWSLDSNYDWQPPTPMPIDDNVYVWDESEQSWVEVPVG